MCQRLKDANMLSSCKKWAKLGAIVFFAPVLLLTVTGWFFGKFDGLTRSLAALALFEGVMRWGLIVSVAIYVLRIPEIRDAIVNVLNRLETLPGGIKLNPGLSRKDKEDLAGMFCAVLKEQKTAAEESGPTTEKTEKDDNPKTVEEVLNEQDWTRTMEQWAIGMHLRLTKSIELVQGGFDFARMRPFDSLFKHGKDLVAVEVKRFTKLEQFTTALKDTVMRYDGSREPGFSPFPHLSSLHILICLEGDAKAPAMSDRRLADVLGNRDDIRVFLYRFDKTSRKFKSMEEVK